VPSGAEGAHSLGKPPSLAEIERAWVFYVLEHVAGGQKRMAAKLLGIDESTLHRKLERYSRGQGSADDGSASG
jgi:DNA-binding NtrC family response regulator